MVEYKIGFKEAAFYMLGISFQQGPVVQSPISTNPGLTL